MSGTGTIKADGRVKLDGYVPEDTRLVGISRRLIAIKHPGGRWWDNGGEHYTSAWIEIKELEDLARANEPGEYRFRCKKMGLTLSFHPTPKTAQREAMKTIERMLSDG